MYVLLSLHLLLTSVRYQPSALTRSLLSFKVSHLPPPYQQSHRWRTMPLKDILHDLLSLAVPRCGCIHKLCKCKI
ncbi:hypothetical protein BDQ17DRAFT_1372912 [Cyathus striatus]|nr:hypothetical protein BDQ17DRAFT_1372912 [Cyathus striatus]